VDEGKLLLSSWPHLFWENFALNRQTLPFLYPSLSQIFLSNRNSYAGSNGGKQIFDLSPEARRAKLFLPGLLSERSDYCLFCGGTPSIGCPFTLKDALQHCQHCCNVRSARTFHRGSS
jgi:hypothetical protein